MRIPATSRPLGEYSPDLQLTLISYAHVLHIHKSCNECSKWSLWCLKLSGLAVMGVWRFPDPRLRRQPKNWQLSLRPPAESV